MRSKPRLIALALGATFPFGCSSEETPQPAANDAGADGARGDEAGDAGVATDATFRDDAASDVIVPDGQARDTSVTDAPTSDTSIADVAPPDASPPDGAVEDSGTLDASVVDVPTPPEDALADAAPADTTVLDVPIEGESTSDASIADATGGDSSEGGIVSPLRLNVRLDRRHDPTKTYPISPLIYGVNGPAQAAAARAKLVRLGGNQFTPYNWEINAGNGGKFAVPPYANVPVPEGVDGGATPGAAVAEVLAAAAANGGAALVTVPIGKYVAGDRDGTSVVPDAGAIDASGVLARFKNNLSTGCPSPIDSADPEVCQDQFVSWVKTAAYANGGNATPVLLSLDNQPELWKYDHDELYVADDVTYEKVVERSIEYAATIKFVWPEALVTGPVSWGWPGFLSLESPSECAAHGEWLAFYLTQMSQAAADGGHRLLDYVDVHWWSQVDVGGIVITGPAATPPFREARVQAPRSLWDTNYTEHSWICDDRRCPYPQWQCPIALIPRLQQDIATNYAGTKLAISAWYYGGGDDISGAIATADALGIYGRQAVDLAAIALSDGDESYTLAGFQAFLNYDGLGAHFGDTSVWVETNDDNSGSSAYASIDSAQIAGDGEPSRVVLVAINKQTSSRTTVITIQDIGSPYTSCSARSLVETLVSPGFGDAVALQAIEANTFVFDMPAMSVSVIVAKQGTGDP